MKKLYAILPVLLIAFALQACKSSKEVADSKNTLTESPTKATDETALVTSDAPSERTLFASIERTPCFGRCPTYTMKIYSDGFVEFNGERDHDMIGLYTTTITQQQMDAILETANDIEFFTFDDKYDDGMVTDLPSTTTTIVADGKTKSVMRRHGHPKSLVQLEQAIDAVIKSARWLTESGEIYPPER